MPFLFNRKGFPVLQEPEVENLEALRHQALTPTTFPEWLGAREALLGSAGSGHQRGLAEGILVRRQAVHAARGWPEWSPAWAGD